MAEEEAATTGSTEQAQQQFTLQRIFLKDLSFESPGAPKVFAEEWKPSMNVDLNTRSGVISGDNYEVVLTVTITAKTNEETVYLIEVQQAGIFLIRGIAGEALRRVLATVCPSTLFPYARETIDSVVSRGTFPAVMLAPVNFEALFQQALRQAEAEAAAPAGEDPTTH
ncbi:MAG: protein-export chaperone SecB [Halieaceae bacterium]|nr:protein-export chaperone SecB [Halieaceae bacterium]